MKKATILSCLIILPFGIFAQDMHFSQFTQASSLINPAMTSVGNTFKAALIYRNQWSSITVPFKTYGASIEMKLKASNWERQDHFKSKSFKKAYSRMAGGLSFFSDKAGDGNMGSTQVNVSLANFIPLSKQSSLSLGLQGSLIQRRIDFSKLIFPDQYTGVRSVYDSNMDPGENYSNSNFTYTDFSGGIAYTYSRDEKRMSSNDELKGSTGISVYHFNQHKQSYLTNSNEKISIKYILHGDYLIGIKNANVAIAPAFLIQMQLPSTEFIVGSIFKYYLNENSKYTGFYKRSAVGIGAFYRNKDALILSSLIEIRHYTVGLSYDLSVSKIAAANTGRGGMELFIRFNSVNHFLYQKR